MGFLNAECFGADLHIWLLAVRHDCQGRGIGRRLMRRGEIHARDHGLRRLTLSTFRDVGWNEGFYSGLGFAVVDEAALDERLRKVLRNEAEHGLPPERRCAMQLVLARKDSQGGAV